MATDVMNSVSVKLRKAAKEAVKSGRPLTALLGEYEELFHSALGKLYDEELVAKQRRDDAAESERILLEKFLSDLFEDNGVSLGNPRAVKVYDLAWQMGHSEGLTQVKYHFETLVELVKVDYAAALSSAIKVQVAGEKSAPRYDVVLYDGTHDIVLFDCGNAEAANTNRMETIRLLVNVLKGAK